MDTIVICGAGTMGSGITQLCAQNEFNAILYDVNVMTLEKAREGIKQNLQHLVNKGKISFDDQENIYKRITFTDDVKNCIAGLIIEAVVENIDVKIDLLNQLAQVNNVHTIFATNTSSLSVSMLQKNSLHPEKIIGMHFFNPAPLMKLVEVARGTLTGDSTVETICDLCKKMGKTPVVCKDAPGFIVNRIARHYYLESMKLAEDEVVSLEDVDAVMEATGFKMGPFKLMDIIGMDINLAVSQSIYEAFNRPERFKPSSIQIDKVNKGDLGKKTGKGFYNYDC